MRDDLDAKIGEIFRRLSMMRLELGEGALDRAIQDVLQALGVAAHREAERRARALEERRKPPTTSIRVTAFADRRQPETLDESDG